MSRIALLGDRILLKQAELGLENARLLNPGLTDDELTQSRLLRNVLAPSELHDLYGWRDGTVSDDRAPMASLWLRPGFFLVSSQEALKLNEYLLREAEDWSPSWFPLLSDGAVGLCLYDTEKISQGKAPIFHNFPDSVPSFGQIYDNIEAMLMTFLRCYEEGAYFKGRQGCLDVNAPHEVAIARALNRESDYWLRGDLF